jgi:hypothetical protein
MVCGLIWLRLGNRKHTTRWIYLFIISNHKPWEILYVLLRSMISWIYLYRNSDIVPRAHDNDLGCNTETAITSIGWLIDYLRFYVPLKNISLIWRRHHCRWKRIWLPPPPNKRCPTFKFYMAEASFWDACERSGTDLCQPLLLCMQVDLKASLHFS